MLIESGHCAVPLLRADLIELGNLTSVLIFKPSLECAFAELLNDLALDCGIDQSLASLVYEPLYQSHSLDDLERLSLKGCDEPAVSQKIAQVDMPLQMILPQVVGSLSGGLIEPAKIRLQRSQLGLGHGQFALALLLNTPALAEDTIELETEGRHGL